MARAKRRRRLALPLLVIPALLAAACGQGGQEGSGEQIELRFSWWGSDARHEITNQVIERFEQQNPNITISGEFTGWDGYWDKLATMTAGQNTPDIMQMEWRYIREYADRGVLADLSGSVNTAEIDSNLLESGKVGGELAAVPAGVNAFGVVADPTVFEEAGVQMPDDSSWSWADFAEIGQRISANTPDDVYGVENSGYGYNEANLQIFARQRGEALYSADGVGFSQGTVTRWWRNELDLQRSGAAPPASLSAELNSLGVDQSLHAQGKAGMAFWWTNELTALIESSGNEDLQLLRFPGESTSQQPGMFLKPAMFFSISAQTEHPEAAAKFVNFMLNSPEAVQIMGSDRGLPVNLKMREQVGSELSETDARVADFIQSIRGDLGPPPKVPPKGAGEMSTIIQRFNDEVLFERMPVEQAAARYIEEAEAALGS